MALAVGTKLGPYEILGLLSAGGMGEVYRAKDTRLGREVALKILPESLAVEDDRLRRFEQEARAVAALNHPNILAVFDIGQDSHPPFLVSELLEGESLRAVLDRGPLPQRKTIEYGVQIAHGLAAAHEKRIVHRDLKPENIFITRDGRVKILDFGLAKLAQGADPEEVTLTSSQTAAGVVMGTASYMAPEQVRGEATDARTDIFAFGAVLYEMLEGQRAFRRDTAAETMTAVLKEDPAEMSDPGRGISPALERTVRRCLEKNPEQRFQSARDLSFALSALSGSETGRVPRGVVAARSRRPLLQWLGMALALIAVAGLTWWLGRPAPSHRLQFAIAVPEEMSVSHLAVSSDGSMLVFVSPEEHSALPMLFVQRIGSPTVTPLRATEGASYPFWSPDATSVGYFANGKLLKIAISGGTPQVLASVLAARGGSWGSRGIIIYAPDAASPIWRVNADGSGAAPVTEQQLVRSSELTTHRWPVFLPDGNHFLMWAGNFSNAKDDRTSGIYAASLDGKELHLLVNCRSSFAFDAHHLYYADDNRQVVSIDFDESSAKVSGSTSPSVNQVGFQPSTYWAAFTAAQNGTLIYNTDVGAAESALTWIDRSGKVLQQIGDPAVMANPTLSPDGSRVAVDISDLKANNVDVWLLSTQGAGNTRFTFDPVEEVTGVWSRDGGTLAYRSLVPEGLTIFAKPTGGLQSAKQVLHGQPLQDDFIPNSWSLDGKQILCTDMSISRTFLALVPAEGGTPTPLLPNSKANETNGQFSPDGKWVAYASDESGTWEIYVTSFPGVAGKWQVSRGGGREPRWRRDGTEIFYIGTTGMLMAVPVNAQTTFVTGTPAPLFQVVGRAPISSTDLFTYDAASNGQRFLVNRYVKPEHVPPLTILMNATQ